MKFKYRRKNKISDILKKIIFDKEGKRINPAKVSVCLLLVVLSVSVAYSALNSSLNITGLLTEVRLKSDIRITDVSVTQEGICTLTEDNDDNNAISTGDKVTCDTERFYVIPNDTVAHPESAGDGMISMLAEKNITLSTDKPKQSEEADTISFADSEYYWDSTNDTVLQEYSSGFVYDSNSKLYPYVEAYENYLISLGIIDVSATLLNKSQLDILGCSLESESCENAPEWVYSTSYWLGTVSYVEYMYHITNNDDSVTYGAHEDIYMSNLGIRPVVILHEDDIIIPSEGSTVNYEEHNKKNISLGINLPYQYSNITYKVDITNIGNVEMGISEITGLPENLDYQISGYRIKNKICNLQNQCKLGITKELYFTIKYKEDGFDSSKTTYDLNLTFEFKPAYNVTYTNIENSDSYPSTVLEDDTLTVNFKEPIPSNITVNMGGSETTDYTYADGILSIPDVTGNIEVQKVEEQGSVTLAQHITNLYTPNSTVVNNGITYNIDTTNGIIDDGLGGTVASGGNLRYYGANPDNYIDIGDRDENNNPILWRIIGVFETKYATDTQPCNVDSDSDGHFDNCASDKLVKIIRNDSIGDYIWDLTSEEEYDNNWSDSTLQIMLNGAYYNSTTTDYYYYEEELIWTNDEEDYAYIDVLTKTTADFTNTGLSSTVQNKIETTLWSLGGCDFDEDDIYNIYRYERGIKVSSGNPTEWVGKVGLMYPSDYGYATDLTKCSEDLMEYSSSTNSYACRTNDWLYNSSRQWTISPYYSYSTDVFFVNSEGSVYITESHDDLFYTAIGTRPVLYLKSDVSIVGEGTTSDGINYKIVG